MRPAAKRAYLLLRLLLQLANLAADVALVARLAGDGERGWAAMLSCTTLLSAALVYVRFFSSFGEDLLTGTTGAFGGAVNHVVFELPQAGAENMPVLLALYNGALNRGEALDAAVVALSSVSFAAIGVAMLGALAASVAGDVRARRRGCCGSLGIHLISVMPLFCVAGYWIMLGAVSFAGEPEARIKAANWVMLAVCGAGGLALVALAAEREDGALARPENPMAMTFDKISRSGSSASSLAELSTVSTCPSEASSSVNCGGAVAVTVSEH